ncbi:hypothetical protein BXZ70DRAFT_1025890 [Cristinia sonorae]|uniref:Protein kinase domain-containing protein n=1 Tax=Cristinia sonorae TaxID=1940300 RepID=A0A8K0XP71_9AGAR|nr:hypothetical protein BXZ70DRAFT_1025890 [Cristinia sonorae]
MDDCRSKLNSLLVPLQPTYQFKTFRHFLHTIMRGFWTGPADPQTFMESFMSTKHKIPMSKLSKVSFASIPQNPTSENDMHGPFIDAFAHNTILSKDFVLNVATRSADEMKLRPAITLRPRSDSDDFSWELVELGVTLQESDSMDGFRRDYDDLESYLDDGCTEEGTRTQKLISAYAAAQFYRQHRTFIFSVLLCGDHARFLRWDRAGCVVTRHFNYREDPSLLAQFFWRYCTLPPSGRGFDPSAEIATPSEKRAFRMAIDNYLADKTSRIIPGLDRSLDPSFPCYKIVVKGGNSESCDLILQKPLSTSRGSVGRCTRAYIAFDITQGKLVFLKDYWRPCDPDRPPEGEVYAALEHARVPHLPRIRAARDVPDIEEAFQSTITQEWRKRPGICACEPLREYRHHRIVQDLAFQITTVRNSRELVEAMANVVECISSAHESQWLHRDVSSGNVMLNEYGKGILNDWDHGFKIDPEGKFRSQRTGTWHFLSTGLAENPSKTHDMMDDLESCFWVLLYVALRHFESDATPSALEIFDHFDGEDNRGELIGGLKKKHCCRSQSPRSHSHSPASLFSGFLKLCANTSSHVVMLTGRHIMKKHYATPEIPSSDIFTRHWLRRDGLPQISSRIAFHSTPLLPLKQLIQQSLLIFHLAASRLLGACFSPMPRHRPTKNLFLSLFAVQSDALRMMSQRRNPIGQVKEIETAAPSE